MISPTPIGGRYRLDIGYYSPKANILARQIPGVERSGNSYTAYADAMTLFCNALRAQGLQNIGGLDDQHAIPELAREDLRDYQRVGAAYLVAMGEEGCILGDGM